MEIKNTVKRSARKVKNHVVEHKFEYAWFTVAVMALVGSAMNCREFDKFMIEKGIDPKEFWDPESFTPDTV